MVEFIDRHDTTLRGAIGYRPVEQIRRDLDMREEPSLGSSAPMQATPYILENIIRNLQPSSATLPPVNQFVSETPNQPTQPAILFGMDARSDGVPDGMASTGIFDFDFDLPAYSLEALADPTANLPQLEHMMACWNGAGVGGGDMWQM